MFLFYGRADTRDILLLLRDELAMQPPKRYGQRAFR